MIIEKGPQAEHPAWPELVVVGQYEAQRPNDMRCDAPQHFALHQRLAHQAEFVVFEVAQAAMDELGRGAGRAGSEIALLAEQNA